MYETPPIHDHTLFLSPFLYRSVLDPQKAADDDTVTMPANPPVILVKKMDAGAVIPSRSDANAAGFDLHSLDDRILAPGDVALLRTGIGATPPPGAYLRINGRSGLTSRGYLVQPGVVDADYVGEIYVVMFNSTRSCATFGIGDRIAQMIPELYSQFCLVEEVDELVGARGSRGFGASGV